MTLDKWVWWIGNTGAALVLSALFTGNMMLNWVAATDLLTQREPYGTPIWTLTAIAGVVSVLMTSLWFWPECRLVRKMVRTVTDQNR